jgi:hypothetical protein
MQNNTKLTLSRLSQLIFITKLLIQISYETEFKVNTYFVSKVDIRPLETQVMLSACNRVSEYLESCHIHTHTRQSYKIHWINHLKPSGHYMYRQFNIQQLHVLPTQCIYVFCVDLRTNSDYFPILH